MKREAERPEKEGKNEARLLVVLSLLLSLLFISALALMWGINFAGNDETGLMKTARINSKWEFSNDAVRVVLTFLYRVFPNVSWYAVWMLLVLFACIAAILYCLLEASDCRPAAAVPICVSALAVLSYFTISVSFTVNSALCAVAASMLILRSKGRPLRIGVSAVFLLFSSLIRFSAFEAVLPFFCLALLYDRCPFKSKKDVRTILSMAALILVCFALNKLDTSYTYREQHEHPEYQEDFELGMKLRIFQDYPHLTYDEAPELYQSVHWDRELYDMVELWYFMDERITSDALTTVMEAGKSSAAPETADRENASASQNKEESSIIQRILDMHRGRYYKAVLAADALAFFALLRQTVRRKEGILRILLCTAFGLVMAAELFYLFRVGRMIPRAFICAALPPFLLYAQLWSEKLPKRFELLWGLLLCAAVLTLLHGQIFQPEERAEENRYNLLNDEVDLYCAAHPDSLFIYDYSLGADTRLKQAVVVPQSQNTLFWGGTSYKTTGWYRFLAAFGFDGFEAEDFFANNVYLLSGEDDFENSAFWRYLRSIDANASYELAVQSPSGLRIYRFFR